MLELRTSLFLHGGWLYLIGNMIYQCILGDDIGEALGHGRYLLFCLGVGGAASLVRLGLSGPARPGAGAVGAIAGVLEAYILDAGLQQQIFMATEGVHNASISRPPSATCHSARQGGREGPHTDGS